MLKNVSPNTNELWIDTDTVACTKNKCRKNYTDCLGAKGFPPPFGWPYIAPTTEDMVLVFSDEFNSRWRDFSPGKDAKWQALDLKYVNDDAAMFRRDAVRVKGGSAIITATQDKSSGPFSSIWGDFETQCEYTSGMLQGWNKFCFTGGYLEARVKLPGDEWHGGLWPAIFTLGNLGRAGYLRSTSGTWPWSYDICDSNALEKQPWEDHPGQRINRCNSTKGRGASEIDLFEVGVWQSNKPQMSTSLQVAPVMPVGTHWLDHKGGTYYPTYADPSLYSGPNGWAGINSYMGGDASGNQVFRPRPGSGLADSMSATHALNASHFTDFHLYGVDWAPGRYLRWYLNDVLIYELNSIALQGATNGRNESVGDRLIPVDPQYININVAMSNSFAHISADLKLPAAMEVDYIRVYQSATSVNTGCDTADFPSQSYINAHVSDYKVSLTGYEDFVGDSSVMGPTMEAPPVDETKIIIIAVCSSVGGVLLIGGAVGFFLWRRWKKKKAQEAADAEAAAGGKPALEPPPPPPRRWLRRLFVQLCYGSPAANARNALEPKRVKVAPYTP